MRDPTLAELSPLRAVAMERIMQDAQYGQINHRDADWLAILSEEVGEAAECITKLFIEPIELDEELDAEERKKWDDLLDYEIVQIAAVAVAWLEGRRRVRGENDLEGEKK